MITLFGGNKNIDLKWWRFPAGERSVKIVDPMEIRRYQNFRVHCDFQGSDDLIDMLLLVNAVRNVDPYTKLWLQIPYLPFARQDRVMTEGEPFALQVAVQLINSCNFSQVEVWDPHSDVLAGMFAPGVLKVVPQEYFVKLYNLPKVDSYLVSPDAGALKKIYKSAKTLGIEVIQANKNRNPATGEIINTHISSHPGVTPYSTFIIIDDICDGGRTFIDLALAIKSMYNDSNKLILSVTHGIFSKGLEPLECFDKIYCANNMSGLDLDAFNKRNNNV